MSSEVKIRSTDFMESQNEKESLRSRIREVEDENQELRSQNLLQNRTIIEQRNELMLLRVQMSELSDTNTLLRDRVRTLQNAQLQQQENEGVGPVTVPPLMAPPPVPPPLPSARIRISPRQVGAGEAITTPLGISLTSPPHYRIKRDCRQGFYRSTRNPYRRFDNPEPGPSSQTPFFSSERPNYFLGLKIIPQFQSFVHSSSQLSNYDSASDSSGSDETPQMLKKPKPKSSDLKPTHKKPASFSRDLELFKNARNLQHQKVRQSFLQNYNLSLPKNGSKFFFPLSWDRKGRENTIMPSTSENEDTSFHASNFQTSERVQGENRGLRNPTKISDCIQYTFPTIHEGLHHHGVNPMVSNGGQPSRVKKFKKSISCLSSSDEKNSEVKKVQENGTEATFDNGVNQKKNALETMDGVDSESLFSFDDTRRPRRTRVRELPSDFEQDGFQADESSNCLTSTDNSLERISLSEFKVEKKN